MDKKLWEIYLHFQAPNYHLQQATVYDKRKNKTGLKGRIFAFVQIRTANRKSSELKNRTIYAQNYKQQQPTTVWTLCVRICQTEEKFSAYFHTHKFSQIKTTRTLFSHLLTSLSNEAIFLSHPIPKSATKKSFWRNTKSSLKNIKTPTERQCNIKNINSFIKSPAGVCEPSEPFRRASVRRISPKIFITFMPE